MIQIDITKEGKGRHRRVYFEVTCGDDSENFISIRKSPRAGKVKLETFIENGINPITLSSMFHTASIICTLIGLHLDFVQIHHALQSIEGLQVNPIQFESEPKA